MGVRFAYMDVGEGREQERKLRLHRMVNSGFQAPVILVHPCISQVTKLFSSFFCIGSDFVSFRLRIFSHFRSFSFGIANKFIGLHLGCFTLFG